MSARLEIDRIERIVLSATVITREVGSRVFHDGYRLSESQMRALEDAIANARKDLP